MAKEYISREAAISKIRDQGILGGDYDAYEREEDVVDMLNSIPAADVVEVRHGHWKRVDGYPYPACSECGCESLSRADRPYCPSCGARMDGGQDDGSELELPEVEHD